jgi:zinc transporter 2
VLGALATVLIIWTLLGVLIYESIERIIHIDQVKIDGKIMLITACIGLFFNLVNLVVLKFCFNDDEEPDTK